MSKTKELKATTKDEVVTKKEAIENAKPALEKLSKKVKSTKRFVISKALIGTGTVIEFTTKTGDKLIYDHDLVYKAHKERFDNMPCFEKYSTYTNSNALPKFVREMDKIV